MKKCLAIILALVMAFGCMSVAAFAASEPTTITWEPGDVGELIVTGDMCENNTIKGITLTGEGEGPDGWRGSPDGDISFVIWDPFTTTFTSSVGKISKIEIEGMCRDDSVDVSEGWSYINDSSDIGTLTWTGTPSDTVTLGINSRFGFSVAEIVFTIAPEEPENDFLTSFTLNKDYNDKYSTGNKTTAVNETVTYTITAISTGDDVPEFENDTFTITVTGGVGSAEVPLPETITKAGDYWYSITETDGKTAGVTYDTNTYYLHLVTDCKDGEFGVVTAQIHVTEPDLTETDYEDQFVNDASDKIDTVSNSYGEGKLKITQDTKIDGEDNDYDEFEVTVTFTLPEGTEITGDITYGDNQKVTFDENGVGTAVITLKDGEYVEFDHIPDGTTYEVTQTGSNTDKGFSDPDYTIENGETGEDTVVTDDSDKETKVTGTISDGEDDITIANEMTTPVDVGVILENGAFILLALGAIVLGAWLVISKRRKALDAE